MPGAMVEEQARIAGRVYSAVSGDQVKALPSGLEVEEQPLHPFRPEGNEHLGNGHTAAKKRRT
jgi:hypothetical protein